MVPDTINVSWSALRTHEECRMKGRLMREGKRTPVTNLRNFYQGMVVDSVMQAWLADPNRQPGQMVAMVDDQIDKGAEDARVSGDGIVRWRHPGDRDEVRAFCIECVRRLEPLLVQHVTRHRFYAPFRFKVPIRMPDVDPDLTINLTGEMDLLIDRQPGWVVLDLKGTGDDQYYRRVIGQLVFYDLAVLGLHGERTLHTGLIQPMCTEPWLRFDITEQMRRELWARIARMVAEIRADDLPCKEGTGGCSWCEVRHACPRYSPDNDSLGLGLRAAAKEIT